MSTPCDSLTSFADGELSPEDSQAFARHLAGCERCQEELTRLLQLEQAGRRYLERHGPVEVPWHALPRNRWLAAGTAVSVACAVLLVLGLVGRPAARVEPELWAHEQRLLEGRVTYPAADRYRRSAQSLMGAVPTPATAELSHAVLGRLEASGDLSQLVAAYLSAGTPDITRARAVLARMQREGTWNADDVLCDLGMTWYTEARSLEGPRATAALREALRRFNEVLRRTPTHAQARWNRALVYRDLGLPLSAMEDLTALERSESNAQWKSEARERYRRLASMTTRKARWQAADAAGYALITQGVPALGTAQGFVDVPLMRRDFYHAVRARSTAAEVREFLPLAQQLDALAGGTVLADYVQRIANRDFSARAPLAAQYARLMTGQVDARDQEALLKTFLASAEDDIAVGALTVLVPRLPGYADELVERTRDSQDPWFQVLRLQTEAAKASKEEKHEAALDLLGEALDLCERKKLTLRCIEVSNDLSHEFSELSRINEAEQYARKGLLLARLGQWDQERVLLQTLGNIARQTMDVTLGRAYFGEALLMADGDKRISRNVQQNLAHLAIWSLELDEARAALDRALDLGLPLTQHGVAALTDVARTRRSSRDEAAVEQALTEEPGDTPGKRAYAKFLRGRFLVELDPSRGRALLEEAIREAESVAPQTISVKHVRAYSYTSLIFADAAKGDFATALSRFGAELGFDTPSRCVLALTEDTERDLLVARGAEGQLLSRYRPVRDARWPSANLENVVPPEMVAALRPCDSVDVLARPPLQGREGLLPPELAWRYRTRATQPRPPPGAGTHLVVSEVRYDEQRNQPLLTWEPRVAPGATGQTLRDLSATPSQVEVAMKSATDIDLATHGKVDPVSRMSYLLLAPGPEGGDTLDEDRIRRLKLSGAPLIVMAACEAARGTPALHARGSLPDAFLEVGARTVLAATRVIPNEDASAFFGDVRERIRGGATPSVAARDERLEWLAQGGNTDWVKGILVFE
ncbi:CHAT domain-containing protein [Pyxidicoccus sp. 3LG]